MSTRIVHHKQLQRKSRSHTAEWVSPDHARVTSGTSGITYHVCLQGSAWDGATEYTGARCTCGWGIYRPSADWFRSGCSHVQAAFDALDDERTVSAWATREDAKRQHRPVAVISRDVVLTSRLNGNGKNSRTAEETLARGREMLHGNEDWEALI